MIVVHLNSMVTFRMTDAGLSAWRQSLMILPINVDDFVQSGRNEDGTYTWTLWQVMQRFGPHIFNGMPHPLLLNNELSFDEAGWGVRQLDGA